MKVVFIRHGEAEHTLDPPRSLDLRHPSLTASGRSQVTALREALSMTGADLIVASPTRRTIETAEILRGAERIRFCISPALGPRMFPTDPRWLPLRCDEPLDVRQLEDEHPDCEILDPDDMSIWTTGINTLPDDVFRAIGGEFIAWCRSQRNARVLLVSHDGTITSYRQLLGETGLTRRDFLGDAGLIELTV